MIQKKRNEGEGELVVSENLSRQKSCKRNWNIARAVATGEERKGGKLSSEQEGYRVSRLLAILY